MQLSPVPPQRQGAVFIDPDRAAYKITAEKGFFASDDNLYPYGSMLYWEDEPNQEMEPLNQPARDAMIAFLTKLDKHGREAAEKAGRSYNGLADAFENAMVLAKQDAKKVQAIGGSDQVPLMGAKKRGRVAAQKIDTEENVPQTGSMGRYSVNAADKAAVNKADGII